MSYDQEMSKDPANMTHAERMSALMRDLHNPTTVAKADKMLELIGHEWLDVLGVRDMAARRHSDTSTAPPMPVPPLESARREDLRSRSGTIAGLVDKYRTDARSRYSKVRFKTREHYDTLFKRILEDCGNHKLADLKVEDIERFYKSWIEGGKISMGHALIGMLRLLANFGAITLEDRDCDQLSLVLHRMRFSPAAPRTERLTVEQATAISREARKMKRSSIALAQAFQFDCKLRQKDVIGEWVPGEEPEESKVLDPENSNKWLRGILWEEIDENLILTHTTSKLQKRIVVDLKAAPMVRQELMLEFGSLARNKLPEGGPVIVSEVSDLPWYAVEFRRNWRKAADKAGVPRTVRNMDTRSGAISDTKEARASAKNIDLSFKNSEGATAIETDEAFWGAEAKASTPRH